MNMPPDDDPPTRTVRLRIVLLVATYLACWGVYARVMLSRAEPPDWLALIVFAVLYSLPNVLAFGLVLLAPLQRLHLLLAAVAVLMCGATAYGSVRGAPAEIVPWMVTYTLTITLVLCLPLRLAGISLRKLTRAERTQRSPLRFTIAQIMGLTALVAAVLTFVRWYRQLQDVNELPMELQSAFFYGIYVINWVTASMLALWGILRVGRLWLGISLAVSVIVAASFLLSRFFGFEFDSWWLMHEINHAVATLLALLVVRSCGYRLVYQSNLQRLIEYLELR